MLRFAKGEKGVISIVVAILIPVIILGVLYAYTMLEKPRQENTVHKIVYASSEAYLSRYNAYLFNQFGILANMDSDTLEPLILHYLMRNKLILTQESAVVTIGYEQLSVPNTYRQAIIEASTVLIGNAMVDYALEMLEQFAFAEQVRKINHSIQEFEKKLSEQFDKSGATQILRRIEMCHDVQIGRREIAALKEYLNEQFDTASMSLETLSGTVTRIKETTGDTKRAMTAFLEGKKAQWHATEIEFLSAHQAYLKVAVQIEDYFKQIESNEAMKRQYEIQLDGETQRSPLNEATINQLLALVSEIEEAIENGYIGIDAIVTEKVMQEKENTPSIIQAFKTILLEAESLLSGVAIGSSELILEDGYWHSINNRDDPNNEALALTQKIKINEYYLSVFSCYDLNCPRIFDPQKRQKAQRIIKGEVEYLVSGLAIEKQSVSLVRLKIFAIRSAANVVTILCDKDKLARLSAATVALPQPWRSLAYGAAIAAWSSAESYSDINRLMKGDSFYFLKTQTQWALDYDALLDGSWKTKVTTQPNESASSHMLNIDDPKLYYMDYLRLLLFIQDEQTTLLRAMDLIEAELLSVSEGKSSLASFSRGHIIDLNWKPLKIFGQSSNENSTIQLRNGFEVYYGQ